MNVTDRSKPDAADDVGSARARRLRHALRAAALASAAVCLVSCGSPAQTAPADPLARPPETTRVVLEPPATRTVAPTGTSKSTTFTVAAVGDISTPKLGNQVKTARLATSWNPTYVLALGDLQYPSGTLTDFKRYYDPTWGRLKSRTRPAPGNHEYRDPGAAGYFAYFGSLAEPKGRPYYSFDKGNWHFVALDSEISHSASSSQLKWLRADLKANKRSCVLAYWHRPRFNSGAEHGSDPGMGPFWDALYAGGGDIVLNGHEHVYERFARQRPSGRSTRFGIRELIVGTGGAESYRFGKPLTHSQSRVAGVDGVLRLTLAQKSYRWAFVTVDGKVRDQGEAVCH